MNPSDLYHQHGVREQVCTRAEYRSKTIVLHIKTKKSKFSAEMENRNADLECETERPAVEHCLFAHLQPVHIAVTALQSHLRQHIGKGKAGLTARHSCRTGKM